VGDVLGVWEDRSTTTPNSFAVFTCSAPALSAKRLGSHNFSDPHIVPLWVILMLSASLALAQLFVQTYRGKAVP